MNGTKERSRGFDHSVFQNVKSITYEMGHSQERIGFYCDKATNPIKVVITTTKGPLTYSFKE